MMRLRRQEFTAATKREAYERSGGICECHRVPDLMAMLGNRPCGCALTTGNTEYDHIIADALIRDNSLDNCAVLTKTCHDLKTNRADKQAIARAKRRSDRHRGITIKPRSPVMGSKASGITKGFDGVPRHRDTGTPWPSAPQEPPNG